MFYLLLCKGFEIYYCIFLSMNIYFVCSSYESIVGGCCKGGGGMNWIGYKGKGVWVV